MDTIDTRQLQRRIGHCFCVADRFDTQIVILITIIALSALLRREIILCQEFDDMLKSE